MSCDGGWIIGVIVAIEVWREWTEIVDYLRENCGQEICRGLRGDTRL